MKKPILFIVALSAVLCACSKEQQTPAPAPLPGAMTITAGTDSNLKTSLNGTTVLWQQDTLVVFDEALAGVKFTTSVKDVATAEFTTDSWTGKVPEYAASYYPEWNTPYEMTAPSKGVLPVEIRPTQAIGWAGTFGKQSFASVGKVTDNNGTFSISEMKNVMGLIGVKFTDAAITKIVATAIGGEQMTGWVTVDYEKLANGEADFWTTMEGKTNSQSATITVSKAGQYYISVLPQTYSQGIKLQVYKGNNLFVERTIGATGGVTISRNKITPLAKDIDDLLPEDITVDLMFYNSKNTFPLINDASGKYEIVAAASQSATGDPYTSPYKYLVGGKEFTENLSFTICSKNVSATNSYDYQKRTSGVPDAYMVNYCLTVGATEGGWIKLPAIKGRYLCSVKIVYGNTSQKQLILKKTPADASAVANTNYVAATASAAAEQYFLMNGSPELKLTDNTSYYIITGNPKATAGRGSNIRIYEIELKYTKTK